METINNLPPVRWALRHPRLAAWIVLSLGMVILLVIEARDVGLQTGNWIALIVATVLVAGACIWIVSWEDVDERAPVDGAALNATIPPAPPIRAEVNFSDIREHVLAGLVVDAQKRVAEASQGQPSGCPLMTLT
jgi:hypothetical protein